jgi:hypothetical protein
MPDDFDPTTIADPTLRAFVQTLMNQAETLHEQVRTQAAEIQRLRDEIARLQGEQGTPDIKTNRPPDAPHDRSSEAERKPPRTPRGKRARNQNLCVTREEDVRCDPATLPEDAQFKGYQPVIVQDVLLSSEAELETYLDTHAARLTRQRRKWVKDVLAIAAYHAHDTPLLPIVQTLVCDDAPQFAMLTEEIALRWIHDGRHYKELEPRLNHHKNTLATFLTKYWNSYRALRRYRDVPTAAKVERLRRGFDKLFQPTTGYTALDKRIAITRQKRPSLLRVLAHPELPLHNNPAELGARQRVCKRDISLGPRSAAGMRVWDAFQTLVDTARKLGVNIYHYLRDRICGAPDLQRLADRITEQAGDLVLGASWPERAPRPA